MRALAFDDVVHGEHVLEVRWSDAELVALELDGVDRALLREVSTADDVSLADVLLALELVARRLEQQIARDR